MILGVTGTRSGPTVAQHAAFSRFMRRCPPEAFVHGGASGWDVLAHMIVANLRPSVPIDIYPADGQICPAWNFIGWPGNTTVYPEAPPLERNRVITERIHWLIAVPRQDAEELRSGTWSTVRYAREIGCPVYLIRSDGTIVRDVDPVFI